MSPAAYLVALGDGERPARRFLRTDQIGTPGGAFTDDRREADRFTRAEADQLAHDWNEYLATKGKPERCRVAEADEPEPDEADAYLIANEASGGRVTYRRRILWGSGWTPEPKQAERWPTLAAARTALAQLEAERPRAGRRFVVAEIAAAGDLAHAEIAP